MRIYIWSDHPTPVFPDSRTHTPKFLFPWLVLLPSLVCNMSLSLTHGLFLPFSLVLTLAHLRYEQRQNSLQPILALWSIGMSAERDTQQGTRGTRGMRLSEIDTDTTSDRGREREYLGDTARERKEMERTGLTQKNRDK